MEAFSAEQPTSSGTRMPQSPRRPVHQLPSQRIPVRRQSVGRLAPGVPGSAVSHIERLRICIMILLRTSAWNLDPLFFPLSICSSTFSMRMTGWFPALPLWWCLTALMVSIRPSSKCRKHRAASWNTENLLKVLRNYTFIQTVNHVETSPGFIVTCSLCDSTEK